MSRFPTVNPSPDFPAIEREVLRFWEADGTFEASVDQRSQGPPPEREFVFYDGPPFANGLPHYGHLVTGYAKDTIPRYRTMTGQRVERVFGWDCHGLPAEIEVERELKVSGHAAIGQFGIDRFNQACRSAVLRYTHEWRRYVLRQGRWVNFDDDYKTMDLAYMESVIWAFKQLWDGDLVYEGYRVLPYCWECETPLSNTETRMDDAYRDREDPAITVAFKLATGELALVWTTTPWTLPSNLALAVNPGLEYGVYELDGQRYVLAASALERYATRLDRARKVESRRGDELVGQHYAPLFEWFRDTPNAFRVLAGDFVSADEGTGIVHLAPAFGEDDQRVCEANGIQAVNPVDARGRFTDQVPPYAGTNIFDANDAVIRDLDASGDLFANERHVHSYPHCWRSGTPLIYKAVDSWLVKVTALKERALALNQDISWIPDHIRDGAFGKWLENARDWSISRNRFWGAPIPVWKSDDPRYPRVDVYGSLDELERDFGVRPDDLHRPYIDELTRPNPDDPTGRSTMRRVEEVLDCWFESGSMPFAQLHYPFARREWFDSHFPADFIVEYVGQTRGWFYTLHVLATALFDRPAFRTAISHGIVLGHDGQKMSKSLRNYPDPYSVFDDYGSDAMRWFLLSSPLLRGQNLIVKEESIADVRRLVLNPIWSVWRFFTLYANASGHSPRIRTDVTDVLDRYALAKLREMLETLTERMDAYDLPGAFGAVEQFLDALTNWYIRRSRDRFWNDAADAFDTLYTLLEVFTRATAPLLPFLSEHIYKGLAGARSVHLQDWPKADELPHDPVLVARMDRAREICSTGLSIRKAHKLRVRLPLGRITIAAPDAEELASLTDLIASEVNVKHVDLTSQLEDVASFRVEVDRRAVGPRLGRMTPKVLAGAERGDVEALDGGRIRIAGEVLQPDEYRRRLVPNDDLTSRLLPSGDGIVVLDTICTPEFEAEGLARDVTRLIQVARKDAGLEISDSIRLELDVPDDVARAVSAHEALVLNETLATELAVRESSGDGRAYNLPDGREVRVTLARAGEK